MSKNSDDGQHSSFKKWTEFKDLDRRHVPPPRSPSELINFGDNNSEFHSRSLPINLDNPLSDLSSHAMLLSHDEFTTFSKEHDSLAEGVCQKAFGTEMSGAADLVNPEPNINPDLIKPKPENFHREDKDAFETISTSSSFSTDKSQLSLTKHFPDSPRNTFTPVRFSSGNERILIDDDLFSDPRHTNSLDLEQSLELFQSAQTVNTSPKKIPKPPRPPPPAAQILQETEHPLMTSEPIQVDEVMQYLLEEAELNKKQQKGCRSPAPPLKSITSFNESEEKNTSLKSITSLSESEEKNTSLKSITSLNESEDKATCEGSLYDETAYGSVSRKPLFVRGQKLRYFKETIKDKANKAYNRWYYPKYKGAEPSVSDSKERKTSESSNESFQEINNDDIEPLEDPVDDNFQPSTAFSSPNRHSDNSSDEQMPPQIAVPIVVADTVTTESSPSTTIPQPPSFSSIHISSNQRKYILYSIWACAFSVLTYFLLFSSRIFIHGILTGTLIPLLCCFVYQYFSSSNEEDNRVRNYSTVQCNRLRDMGSKYTIKDFFQYTESPNFGDLRFKNLPYRYIKLKGCVIEAYELNATKYDIQGEPMVEC